MGESNFEPPQKSKPSADSGLTRQAFIRKIVKGAALTGSLAAAPVILDTFLVPKAYAATSTSCASGDATSGGVGSAGDVGQNGGRAKCTSGVPTGTTACTLGNDILCT